MSEAAPDKVVLFPGTDQIDVDCRAGVPRHDMVALLAKISEMAANGELSALAIVACPEDSGTPPITGLATPWFATYRMIAALEFVKRDVMNLNDRKYPDREETIIDRNLPPETDR